MSQFKFDGRAEIRNINIRKEGPEDDKVLAVDVKFLGRMDSTVLQSFDDRIKDFLFTDGVIVRNIMLRPIGFQNQIKNCELELLGKRIVGVKLHKFEVSPCDGGDVYLSFTATFDPTKDEVALISEFVLEEVKLIAKPQPGLDLVVDKS